MYRQWQTSGIKVIGIGLLDTAEACRQFVRRYHLSFPNGYDGDGKIARLYGFTYQPYWAVIDRDEHLLETGYGPAGDDDLVVAIKRLTAR